MSAYKQFLASDIIVTPFEVNKSFTFQGAAALTGSNVGIDRFLGKNIQSNPFNSGSNPTTGQISILDQELVYESIKHLYYANFLSSSFGDSAPTASLVPGADRDGDRFVGTTGSNSYVNFFPTTLDFAKNFPTGLNDIIGVISIPTKLFGDYIQPSSLRITADSGSLYDDGEGNLLESNSNSIVGNVFYQHGIITIIDPPPGGYGSSIYGISVYGGPSANSYLTNFITSSNITCSFSSSYTIFESQYKCTARANEFNFSLNPSIISGSTDGTVYGFASASYFTPYVTTVGLYDEDQNLLAIGKLAQPLPLSQTTDTTILINIDR